MKNAIINKKGAENRMKEKIIEKVKTMLPLLNEKQKRLYLAAEAIAYGRGGITFMSHISGVSRSVITTNVINLTVLPLEIVKKLICHN